MEHKTNRNTYGPAYGYNLHEGGNCPPAPKKGVPRSEQTKAKISARNKGKIMIVTEEAKAKMSASRMGHPGYMKGKKHTSETKEKMSKSQKGHPGYNKGQMLISTDKINEIVMLLESKTPIRQINRITGIDRDTIRKIRDRGVK